MLVIRPTQHASATVHELALALNKHPQAASRLSRYGPVVKVQVADQLAHPLVVLHGRTFHVYIVFAAKGGVTANVFADVGVVALRTIVVPWNTCTL